LVVQVRKRTGKLEKFSKQKLQRSLERAGAPRKAAREIAARLARRAAGAKGAVSSERLREWAAEALHEAHEHVARAYKEFKKAEARVGLESTPKGDVVDRLRVLTGRAGQVMGAYGGFEVRVTDPEDFNWSGVLHEMLRYEYDVWVELRDGALTVLASPRT
jgi:hypothetical protein